MALQQRTFELLAFSDVDTIYGTIAVAAKRGNVVNYKDNGAGSNKPNELELATDTKKVYVLSRDVETYDFNQRVKELTFQDRANIETPFTVGTSVCSAHRVQRAVFEGSDYLDAGITAAAVGGTRVKLASGKLALASAADISAGLDCGSIDRQLTPETTGNVRIEVTFN